MSDTNLVENFETARGKVEKLLNFCDNKLDVVGDVTVQDEVAEARKLLEMARMRIGVALTYHKGLNPWSSTPGAKRRK